MWFMFSDGCCTYTIVCSNRYINNRTTMPKDITTTFVRMTEKKIIILTKRTCLLIKGSERCSIFSYYTYSRIDRKKKIRISFIIISLYIYKHLGTAVCFNNFIKIIKRKLIFYIHLEFFKLNFYMNYDGI